MFKKILICALTLVALLISGCGEEKVVGTPDKAILAYCEIITMGESPNMEAAGFTDKDNKNLRNVLTKIFAESFDSIVPLSDETADAVANSFYENNKAKMTFQAKIKSEDGDKPVVELTTTPLDMSKAIGASGVNDELIALIGMVGKLKSDGMTDEQLKNNPEVQKLAVAAFSKSIKEIPMQPEKTLEVACETITTPDRNVIWAPADVNSLIDFIMGKK